MNLTLSIELYSWWHAGTGTAAGDRDAVVRRNNLGLPEIGGKTIKGLLRQSARLIEQHLAGLGWSGWDAQAVFGPQISPVDPHQQGQAGWLEVCTAGLPETWQEWAREAGAADKIRLQSLYETLAQTALHEGMALTGALRRTEVVMPLTLSTRLSLREGHPFGESTPALREYLALCAALVTRLGRGRHRGLGRCRWQVSDENGSIISLPRVQTAASAS